MALALTCATPTIASVFKTDVAPLIEGTCLDCHDSDSDTHLDFETLGHDLTDAGTFRVWERIFDQLRKGDHPEKKKHQPDATTLATAMTSLRKNLRELNLASQHENGRVPVRRLTRKEYEYTLHDMLGIHAKLAKLLPSENAAAGFDTSAASQGLSPVHIQSYLTAADYALDAVMQLGRQPRYREKSFELDYVNRPYIKMWFDRPIRNGGGTIKSDGDELVTFEKRNHATRSDHAGFRPQQSGLYKIEMQARAYQAWTPVTLVIMKASDKAGSSEMIGSYDLYPNKPRIISLTTYLTPNDYFYPLPMDDDVPSREFAGVYGRGAKLYSGEGVALKDVTITGPLENQWPPEHTRKFFDGIDLRHRQLSQAERREAWRPGGAQIRVHDFVLNKPPLEHLKDMIERVAPMAFRRPLREGEAQAFVDLAKPALDAKRGFDQVARVSFRALFSSPQFLFHSAEPGPLNHFALATRLSYFLWKSLPDEELFRLAHEKKLSDPDRLAAQVDRLLNDPKADRFINDFLDQWIGLKNIDATTPDDKLYPEYDDVLRQAMLKETRLFFGELIADDLSVRNLIDSNFTFLNRRLGEHYEIHGIDGEQFRRVSLPRSRIRGGLMTQASVLKVTANGTVTSPVKRGNFVLASLLGDAPATPPPSFDAIDPDTRGTTTIRETLDKHRNTKACAVCHRSIDPPGFALESFNPIGGFRTRYRSTEKGDRPNRKLRGRFIHEYRIGLPVDASGVTEDGNAFAGIQEYKRLLLTRDTEVARNLISNLLVYSTGGAIQFADREELDQIVERLRPESFPVRSMIHQVVQSRIFRDK